MAVVAGGGAVGITVYATVLIVGLGLLVSRPGVAVDAAKTGVVANDLVAIVADRLVVRFREIGVVKGCAKPTGGVVASGVGTS